jgi:hypothetical protein
VPDLTLVCVNSTTGYGRYLSPGSPSRSVLCVQTMPRTEPGTRTSSVESTSTGEREKPADRTPRMVTREGILALVRTGRNRRKQARPLR